MKWLITGGAGFIGSHFADRLSARGDAVTVFDDFSLGSEKFLEAALRSGRVDVVRGDVRDLAAVRDAMRGCDAVLHLAARSNNARATTHGYADFTENVAGVASVLEAMRATGTRRLVFFSTAFVYGDPSLFPTPEDAPFPRQTSIYGASKAAGEAAITAFAHTFGWNALIFRCVPVVGERYTHGHVIAFYRRLRENPHELLVLGDGRQQKSFVYVHDAVDAVLLAFEHVREGVEIFNVGSDGTCEINDSVRWICARLGVAPAIRYGGGDRGWVGDTPRTLVDTSRLGALGWSPRVGIREAIERTVDYLADPATPNLDWS